ncbi:MAG: prepilin-type N-terminal cleavage/methylation domain-containing protein [Verrucomicrobia bacterium]|nr:prepilin-type N-terminal cleavage/methylation domain-containing protein [Verrucomicrobiota bacterium]MDE3098637.1 prepilin-type N-terminal cleavage/methylation domain-containing protein [Verrucomicrobiota bacterium]
MKIAATSPRDGANLIRGPSLRFLERANYFSPGQTRAIACRPGKSSRGPAFTLIEVMVSMVIFTLVVAAIYSTWYLILRATRVGQAAAAQAQRQRISVQTLDEALTAIQSFQASMQYYTFSLQNGDSPSLGFTARVPDDFPRGKRYGYFPVRRVIFSLEPVTDLVTHKSQNDLVLRQHPYLTPMDKDEQETPYVLARDVQSFKVQCWDTNSQQWSSEWDDTNDIPSEIRFTIVFGGAKKDASNPDLSITRLVSIPSQTMPSWAQAPGHTFVTTPPPPPPQVHL